MNKPGLEELTGLSLSKRLLWLFLDYDGTLAEFAPTPEEITPLPRVVDLLRRLASNPSVRLTVLSGRRLVDICRLLPLSGIYFAGTYGIELRTPAGELVERASYDEIRPFLEVVKPQWVELVGNRVGFFLEDKGWSLALHARFSEEQEAEGVLALAGEILARELPREQFRILGGHKFLEVAPLLAHKGLTVQYLWDKYPLPGAQLLYIGDDDKDEEAFEVVHSHGGIAVKVGSGSQFALSTQADYILESPSEVNSWLETLWTRLSISSSVG